MGSGLFRPYSFLLEVLGTQRQQVISPASCGLPRWGYAMEILTAPCSLCLHWEPIGRWCCHDENGGESGERLHKSLCQCRCRPRPPGGSHLLPGHWAQFHPGHHWSLHPLPFRTIYRCRCGPRWKLCWIEYYCSSVRSKVRQTARRNRKWKSKRI